MDYCYEAEFALDGIEISKPLKESHYSLTPDPSHRKRALLTYSFCMPKLSEAAAEEKAKHDVYGLLNFVLLGMHPFEGRSAFSVKFLKIRCTNYVDLRKAKQKLPIFGDIKFSTTYKLADVTLKRVVGELNKYSSVLPQNIYVALTFWRTGLSSDEEYFRFEQVWKAFEIFYRTITKKTDIEITRIRQWLTKIFPPADMQGICMRFSKAPTNFAELGLTIRREGCQSAFDCLVNQNFTSKSGRTNYSQDLAAAQAKGDHLETLANALMCLTKLRNNVFHANIFSDRERRLVFIGCSVLADIVMLGFDSYISQLI